MRLKKECPDIPGAFFVYWKGTPAWMGEREAGCSHPVTIKRLGRYS